MTVSFQGTVTDEGTDLPIENAQVDLYRPNGALVGTAVTDAAGYWHFDDLTTRKYTLRFAAAGYTPEWWNNKPDLAHATIIAYAAGATVTADVAMVT